MVKLTHLKKHMLKSNWIISPPTNRCGENFKKNCFNHHLDGWSFSSTSPLGILLSNLLAGPTSAWRVPNMPRAGFGNWNSARRIFRLGRLTWRDDDSLWWHFFSVKNKRRRRIGGFTQLQLVESLCCLVVWGKYGSRNELVCWVCN